MSDEHEEELDPFAPEADLDGDEEDEDIGDGTDDDTDDDMDDEEDDDMDDEEDDTLDLAWNPEEE